MNKPTFKEQSEKIIQAYLKCEINPLEACACFIGNLLNGTGVWLLGRDLPGEVTDVARFYEEAQCSITKESFGLYTVEEITALEYNFLKICVPEYAETPSKGTCGKLPNYEDVLFEAMISTLELLKEIHISKGEVIEEEITLQKRELV